METKNLGDYKEIRYILPFFFGNAFIYGLNAIYYSFIPIYLENVSGKNEFERGIILSVGPLIAIIALIVWGAASDKAKYKNSVFILIVAASALMFYAVTFGNSLTYLVIIFAALMFFMSPYGSLIDALTLEYTSAAEIKYGPIRIIGTIVYGVISLVLTFLTQTNISIIFASFIVMSVLAILSIAAMPKIKGHARESKKLNYKEFFADKTVVSLIILLFISQFAFGCYNNFMPNYIVTTLNQPQWIWGLIVLLTISGELVFFIKFEYFFITFGIKRLTIFSLFMNLARYLMFALLPGAVWVIITSIVTGACCTILNYCASYYISKTVKKEMQASGQTVLYSISFYIPRVISGVAGGFIIGKTSYPVLNLICGLGFVVILLLCTKFFKLKMPSKELEGIYVRKKDRA